ncbi:MAG: PQQ-binding-like beta-propeller repeat protein [Anaerolineaceae bacterium]|nr:PQQ-binding-like beta-propeller repeat protein [Anaerolineaceae bacterium]
MKFNATVITTALLAALVGGTVLARWCGGLQSVKVAPRLPGADNRPPPGSRVEKPPRNPGRLIPGPGRPTDLEGLWPQFRGPDRTAIAGATDPPLARSWPEGGPEVLWRVAVGEGHAGAAIHKGRVFVVDYDRKEWEDAIRCLSLADGKEIWRYTYSVLIKRNHGMSRTIAALTDEYLVAMSPKCRVTCLRTDTGQKVWSMDLVRQFGTIVPGWYTGQCPLIDGDRAIIAPGGDPARGGPLMMAVELASGKILWQTPNPDFWKMTESSIMVAEFGGIRQYVYCTQGGVVSVAADDGRLLWRLPQWRIKTANAPSPVVIAPDRLFFTGSYKAGSLLARVRSEGGRFAVEEVFRLTEKVFSCVQQTPILYDGYLYGVIKDGQLACLDLAGQVVWTSGAKARFGLGPFILVDGLLFAVGGQSGELVMAEANPQGYKELGRAKILGGHDAWGPMAYADGRLIFRDLTEMVCVKVSR